MQGTMEQSGLFASEGPPRMLRHARRRQEPPPSRGWRHEVHRIRACVDTSVFGGTQDDELMVAATTSSNKSGAARTRP